MIFKRYGTTLQSVMTNFDSKALTEIGFRRDRVETMASTDFEAAFEHVTTHELSADAEGDVQDETEQILLDRLEEQLRELLGSLGEGEVLVVENAEARDWPKTRQRTRNVLVAGENRLHFTYGIAPPLRIGVYRRRPSV
jgi:hypothetical protein